MAEVMTNKGKLCSSTPQHNFFHALGALHASKGTAAFHAHNCARQLHSTILSILSVRCMQAKGRQHFIPTIVLANATAQFFPCSRLAAC